VNLNAYICEDTRLYSEIFCKKQLGIFDPINHFRKKPVINKIIGPFHSNVCQLKA